MSQYGAQPGGYPQQPQYGQPGQQHGYPQGNQPPAYGQQPQQFPQQPQPVRLTKGGVFEFGNYTELCAVLRWDGRGVDLSKVASLPPGYAAPQQFAPPAYGQPGQQHGYPQGNQPPAYGQQPQPAGPVSQDDLDLVFFVIDVNTGRVISDNAFVFFNQPMFQIGQFPIVKLDGDNRTGNGADDEIGRLNIAGLSPQYKILVGASIYDDTNRKTFGTIKNAEICIVGPQGVLAEYDLDANVKTMAAVIFGEVLFNPRYGWHFCANPQQHANLFAMAKRFGVNV